MHKPQDQAMEPFETYKYGRLWRRYIHGGQVPVWEVEGSEPRLSGSGMMSRRPWPP